jgi:choline dehydrogenase-like flavoprotein
MRAWSTAGFVYDLQAIDASLMSEIPSANTRLTHLMTGEVMAERLQVSHTR